MSLCVEPTQEFIAVCVKIITILFNQNYKGFLKLIKIKV